MTCSTWSTPRRPWWATGKRGRPPSDVSSTASFCPGAKAKPTAQWENRPHELPTPSPSSKLMAFAPLHLSNIFILMTFMQVVACFWAIPLRSNNHSHQLHINTMIQISWKPISLFRPLSLVLLHVDFPYLTAPSTPFPFIFELYVRVYARKFTKQHSKEHSLSSSLQMTLCHLTLCKY